jgi:hypothetical protein
LFFNCCVACVVWEHISEVCGKNLGTDFESVAYMWLHDNKFKTFNICTTATLWAIWKFRNELCFQGARWTAVGVILRKVASTIWEWRLLTKGEVAEQLLAWAGGLERSVLPPQLTWEADQNPGHWNDEAGNDGNNGVNVWSDENVCNRPDGGSVLNVCIDPG